MQWKYESITDLKEYPAKKASLTIIPQEVEALDAHITSIRSSSMDAIRVDGGDDHRVEDALLDAIVKRDKMLDNLHVVKMQVQAIDDALSRLPDRFRDILTMSFIERVSVDDIGDKYNIERSQTYRDRDKALRLFTLYKYGVVDT